VDDSHNQPIDEAPIDVSDPKYDPHILDYFQLVLKYKWTVVFIVGFCSVAALVLTYMVPQVYQSEAVLLPPDRLSSFSLLSRYSSGFALQMLKEVENPSVDVLQNIVESRRMGEYLIGDSELHRYWSHKGLNQLEMLQAARQCVGFRPGFSQVWVSGAFETDWFADAKEKEEARALSARIANLGVRLMDSILRAEVRSLAHDTRVYADSDYAARHRELDSLDRLQEQYEHTHGIVKLSDQIQQTIAQVAALKSARDQAEIRLRILRLDLSQQAATPQTLAAVVSEANRASDAYARAPQFGPALDSLPAVSRQYARILQRKKELEPIVGFLRGEVEQQRIFEVREKSPITVLDSALPPTARFSPKRIPMMSLGIIAGFALSIVYVTGRTLRQEWKRIVPS
jgi:hypothetical protein